MRKEIESKYEHITHEFGPVYDRNAKVLILGSIPSVKSREQQFYYGHPQNRFWKVLAAVFGGDMPETIAEKKVFLLRNHVALWDVIESCDMIGSADSTIKNVKVNDIRVILKTADIRLVCANGNKAGDLFIKYWKQSVAEAGIPRFVKLPSTSPANASWTLDRLTDAWKQALTQADGQL